MIKKIFITNLYIKVSNNKFEVKNISENGDWECVVSQVPFSTNRLLVGKFSQAETTLSMLVKRVLPKGLIPKRPQVVIHPTVMVEGGLSEVEERVFNELALGAGAIKAILHVGPELSDAEVLDLINNA